MKKQYEKKKERKKEIPKVKERQTEAGRARGQLRKKEASFKVDSISCGT